MSAVVPVTAVSVYGVGPMRTLPISDAINFVSANGGSDKALVLGAMREGYLGRQMLSLDDLRRMEAEAEMAARWANVEAGSRVDADGAVA